MDELALFAGGGGGLLGSRLLGWRTICYVECDSYCVEVLKARIRDGYLDDAPIWDDARTFDGRSWAGLVDVVTAGFPCQPFSVAGKGLAELDERNLWPDTIRIARECGAEWLLLENVPGLFGRPYIRRIFADLAESGFDVRWDRLSAANVGAPHRRERQWFVAHAKGVNGRLSDEPRSQSREFERDGKVEIAGNTDNERRGRIKRGQQSEQSAVGRWWTIEPELGRVAYGVAHRVDRLRAIGNGQVPFCMARAWLELSGEVGGS